MHRLDTFLATFLAAGAGCVGTTTKDDHTGTPPAFDDVVCYTPPDGPSAPAVPATTGSSNCPDAATAAAALVGTQTCESPVREVAAVGAFLSEEQGTYGDYGTWVPGGTDSGLSDIRCCYEAAYTVIEGMSCTPGRPLGDGGVAPIVARADWATGAPARVDRAAWARIGAQEHASIAAFSALVSELLALAAPADLVDRAADALKDEIRHARLAFGLAGGVGPGPLPVPGPREASVVRLAVDAFREGCVNETLAVGEAAERLRASADPAERAVLAAIVADESRHAALSWDLVRWALAAGGEPVRRALADAAAALPERVPGVGADGVLQAVVRPEAAALLAA